MVTEPVKKERSTIDFSWFNAKIHASGPITRQIVAVVGLLVVVLSGMWLVQTRVVQKLDAVDGHLTKVDEKLTAMQQQLLRKHLIVAQTPAKKLTAVAMLPKVEHP